MVPCRLQVERVSSELGRPQCVGTQGPLLPVLMAQGWLQAQEFALHNPGSAKMTGEVGVTTLKGVFQSCSLEYSGFFDQTGKS